MSDERYSHCTSWKDELPLLVGRTVTLREPAAQDLGPLVDLLSQPDATRFGLDGPIGDVACRSLSNASRASARAAVAVHLRDHAHAPRAPSSACCRSGSSIRRSKRPNGNARSRRRRAAAAFSSKRRALVGSFAFGTLGTHRLEARVLLQNGRANGALRKLGAVQEGVLRRSVRRGGEYFDQVLWSLLKEDWGDHWVSTAPRVH